MNLAMHTDYDTTDIREHVAKFIDGETEIYVFADGSSLVLWTGIPPQSYDDGEFPKSWVGWSAAARQWIEANF